MSTTPTDPDVEVAPYGASVAGAWALVPEARLYDGPMPPPAGTYAVTVGQVAAWVQELTESVSMSLDGWELLTDVPTLAEDGVTVVLVGDRTRFLGSARTVIHNGAASYLEAARHPERSSVNADSYSAVLWARYTDGLDRLSAWLIRRLEHPEAGDQPDAPGPSDGPLFSFPDPLFGDGLRF